MIKSRNFKATLCIKITIALLLHIPECTAPPKSSVPHLRCIRQGFTSHKTDLRHSSCENLHSKAHRKLRDKKFPARFQAPTALQFRPSLFREVTRRNISEERRTQQGEPFGNKMCSQLLSKLRVDLLPNN
jgi:hypothetical protein